ncbi:MAG: FAD-dependent thymidylate synthase [Thermaerobacter sp.]|nr:FAD-dependent thymidylate synthase [Thermaerobacter sp.]
MQPLERFVSNLDRDVYAILNLPEEVVAVIFAYVSRSPLSFRENLEKLIAGDELAISPWLEGNGLAVHEAAATAAAFHEKWVVGYGHASVAEHAAVHLGIERVSRLASATLELANPYLSFTEYSQRYQQPRRGAFYRPEMTPSEETVYLRAMDALYDAYEEIKEVIVRHLAERDGLDLSDPKVRRRLERLSFEDARYVLPLGMETNLGLSGNARALRDAIVLLRSSPHAEEVALGEAMLREASVVAPTLLRHADASEAVRARPNGGTPSAQATTPVRLLSAAPPGAALRRLASAARPGEDMSRRTEVELISVLQSFTPYGPYDVPPASYQILRYEVAFDLSEAAWHQLLRHRRRIDFTWSEPGFDGGIVIPPLLVEAGAAKTLHRAEEIAREAAASLGEGHSAGRYLILNAHRRSIQASLDLAEVCHLVRQRGKPDAQWEIRQATLLLRGLVQGVHPFAWLPQPEGGE